MKRIHESRKLPVHQQSLHMNKLSNTHHRSVKDDNDLHFSALPLSVKTWKGKNSLNDQNELMLDIITIKGSDDSLDDIGSTSFSGASHPPEPIDIDFMSPVRVPMGQTAQNKSFVPEPIDIDFMSPVHVPMGQKAHNKSFIPEPIDIDFMSPMRIPMGQKVQNKLSIPQPIDIDFMSPIHIPTGQKAQNKSSTPEPIDIDFMSPVHVQTGQNKSSTPECLLKTLSTTGPFLEDLSLRVSGTKQSPLEQDSEKECVWDASLPPSGNVSPHSSIDSTGIIASMSIANSGVTSDGTLSVDRFYESTKGSIRGDSLESGKTSISRASDSSGLSDESNWSNFTNNANKPHKGNDPRWKAILAIRARDGLLGMSHFKLLRRLGCGDIGSVYLSELSGTYCYFAMKVMDKASLASRKKLTRAQTEREILQLLDHPFLPTLYTHFETDRFTCLVMEYCPGGDLHTLRQRQPGRHFSEDAARFYAAEVLLGLEYLHMLGVVYRDLKPENVLVRDDGHIMLSDFDLSLRCAVLPTLVKSSQNNDPSKRQSSCIEPTSVCIQPACFLPRVFTPKPKKRNSSKSRFDQTPLFGSLPELVAEPTAARSMSFVGTHEYLAPEIIKGEGHGSAVDWWTFGIFLHELLYGKTPFKGAGNRATLFNVVGQQLKFPESPGTSYASRDLIRGLLAKEPQHRLGVKRGATEIKQHAFFEGVNWALIRCSTPPEVPKVVEVEPPPVTFREAPVPAPVVPTVGAGTGTGNDSKRMVDMESKSGGNYLDFEFF